MKRLLFYSFGSYILIRSVYVTTFGPPIFYSQTAWIHKLRVRCVWMWFLCVNVWRMRRPRALTFIWHPTWINATIRCSSVKHILRLVTFLFAEIKLLFLCRRLLAFLLFSSDHSLDSLLCHSAYCAPWFRLLGYLSAIARKVAASRKRKLTNANMCASTSATRE